MKITYVEHTGKSHTVEADAGSTLMEAAINNLVPGIVGDCGGCCSCATCHVYVRDAWRDKLAAIADDEEALLDGLVERREGSRLSCQIRLDDSLDGLEVDMPASQF